jgi:hypothetical protein
VIVLCCTQFSDSITSKVSPYTMGCNVASSGIIRTTASDYFYNHANRRAVANRTRPTQPFLWIRKSKLGTLRVTKNREPCC